MGHELRHTAMIDGHSILARCLREPRGYGANLWHLPDASLDRIDLAKQMIASSGDPHTDELVFLADLRNLCLEHPMCMALECDLDRQYQALAFVLERTDASQAAELRRASLGGDDLAGLTSGTGWPYRWLSAPEVVRISVALGDLQDVEVRRAFQRTYSQMEAASVYKAPSPEELTGELAKAWESQLVTLLGMLRRFFEQASAHGFGVLTTRG